MNAGLIGSAVASIIWGIAPDDSHTEGYMTDEEFDSFIARTRDINRLRKAEKIEEEKLKKTASAVATAHNFSSAPCAITGHAYGVLGEPLLEHEPGAHGYKFLARVMYTLFCSKCGHTIEYVQDRRKPIVE